MKNINHICFFSDETDFIYEDKKCTTVIYRYKPNHLVYSILISEFYAY